MPPKLTECSMRLSDGRVLLRPYAETDAPAHCEAANESVAEVGRWLPWCHPDYTEDESRAWIGTHPASIAAGLSYEFAVFDATSGTYLGGCGLNRIDAFNRMANLGYWIRSSAAGKGVCTTAARLAVGFGFGEMGLQRIEIVAAVDNVASNRVAQKLGAVHEAVLRRRFLIDGQPQDGNLYSLTPAEWSASR